VTSGQDRRAFFKHLLREAAGVAQELNSVLRAGEDPGFTELEDWPPRPVPAKPARGSVDEDALLALCREVGLEHRAADVRRLARSSVRLTRAPGDDAVGGSRLGGSPDVPRAFAWPEWQGRELGFLGQLKLDRVAAVDPGAPLPHEGLLLFFYDLDERPSGLLPAHRGSCRVILLDDRRSDLGPDEKHSPMLRAMPLELSRELILPSAWSFHAEELDLSPEDMDAWDELRERLARAQGVELEESSADTFALHRLLGYQDEIGREVELDCQLASAGLDADDVSAYYEYRADHESEARTWRLLLQLSADDILETPRDGGFDRLYLCIGDADLNAGNFDAAWAVLR
jgi:uncharacterized protein YwqG